MPILSSSFSRLLYICLFCLFFIKFGVAQEKNTYKNLALEGAGIRGIAYGGALKVLSEKGILYNIENVAGSSAGAVAGLLIALSYTPPEIDSILGKLKLQNFNDGSRLGILHRVKRKFGIYKGDAFEKWLRTIIKQKTGSEDFTFRQLHELHASNKVFKNLFVCGTNLSTQSIQVFNFETAPDLDIATAVRISCGIPVYFEPIALDDAFRRISRKDDAANKNYFVDGGMLCNYPISMFDTCRQGIHQPLNCQDLIFNKQTLGLKIERAAQIKNFEDGKTDLATYDISDYKSYFTAFGNLIVEQLARKYPGLKNEFDRTIYISDGGVQPRIKKIPLSVKQLLFDNGVKAALHFLEGSAE